MSYEKQTWTCGEMITADKLNHMEEGIEECCSSGGGTSPLIVHESYSEQEGGVLLDVTFGEIFEAINSGRNIYLDTQESPSFDYKLHHRAYMIRFGDGGDDGYTYTAAIEFDNGNSSYGTREDVVSEEAVYQSYPIRFLS